MHELSLSTKKLTYRYIRNQRAKETKFPHFRNLQKSLKPFYKQKLENDLSKVPASTVKTDKFIEYLKTRSKVSKKLRDYYGNELKKRSSR